MAEPFDEPDALVDGPARGRGAGLNPGNRYERVRLHVLGEHREHQRRLAEEDAGGAGCGGGAPAAGADDPPLARVPTTVLPDRTRRVINPVDSPDLGFSWTLNPYRGCEHGCVYCYARPDHERLGMSCGLDFETRIVAKHDAPELLRRELAHPRWRGEPIVMSGVTDPYQPIERELRITRRCLEVMHACGQPVSLITKNRLIARDLDLLADMASRGAAHAAVSLTTLDPKLAREMEPRASRPADRLAAIRALSDAGVPTVVMTAPVICGLNDHELPRLLEAAADAGATGAGYVLLRLPHQLKAVFADWLDRVAPQRAGRVLAAVRSTRGGKLYDAAWGRRQRGSGELAEQVGRVFRVYRKRFGLDQPRSALSSAGFRRPEVGGQGRLF